MKDDSPYEICSKIKISMRPWSKTSLRIKNLIKKGKTSLKISIRSCPLQDLDFWWGAWWGSWFLMRFLMRFFILNEVCPSPNWDLDFGTISLWFWWEKQIFVRVDIVFTGYTMVTSFQIFLHVFVAGTHLAQVLIIDADIAFLFSRTPAIHELQNIGRTSEVVRVVLVSLPWIQLQASALFHSSIDGACYDNNFVFGATRMEVLECTIFLGSFNIYKRILPEISSCVFS